VEFTFSLKENTSPQAGWERSSRSASFVFAVLTAREPCRAGKSPWIAWANSIQNISRSQTNNLNRNAQQVSGQCENKI